MLVSGCVFLRASHFKLHIDNSPWPSRRISNTMSLAMEKVKRQLMNHWASYLHWLHEVLVPFKISWIFNTSKRIINNHESSRISFFPNIYPNMIIRDKMGVDFTSRSFKAPKIPAAWHREMTRLPTLQPRRHEVGFQPMGGWGGDTWSTVIYWWYTSSRWSNLSDLQFFW